MPERFDHMLASLAVVAWISAVHLSVAALATSQVSRLNETISCAALAGEQAEDCRE